MSFERLLFVGTKVLPTILAVGGVHLVYQNIFHPLSPEQKEMFERRRRRKPGRFSGTPNSDLLDADDADLNHDTDLNYDADGVTVTLAQEPVEQI